MTSFFHNYLLWLQIQSLSEILGNRTSSNSLHFSEEETESLSGEVSSLKLEGAGGGAVWFPKQVLITAPPPLEIGSAGLVLSP